MSFEFKKCASHGTSNPIVARLSLQNLQILENCKVTKEVKDKVGGLYLELLMKKLLRCWEIEDSFKKSFAEAAATYKPPAMANAPVEIRRSSGWKRTATTSCTRRRITFATCFTWSTSSIALHSPRRASSRRHGRVGSR